MDSQPGEMRALLFVGLCTLTAGYTGADSHAYLPALVRDKEAEPLSAAAPDRKRLVGTKLD